MTLYRRGIRKLLNKNNKKRLKDMASSPQGFEAFFLSSDWAARDMDSSIRDLRHSPNLPALYRWASAFPAAKIMLFLSAILRMSPSHETPQNDLLAEAQARLGIVGFTIITLVYLLLSLWRA